MISTRALRGRNLSSIPIYCDEEGSFCDQWLEEEGLGIVE